MNPIERLRQSAVRSGSIACMGLDPVIEKIPLTGPIEKRLSKFYLEILEKMVERNIYPASVKPNIAFFEQFGLDGLRALKKIIADYSEASVHIILDAKRADIGKTSSAYAKAIFDFWDADATTVAPYMGIDSIEPFTEYCERGKTVYILTRTSNRGARDIQDLEVDGTPLYLKTAEKIVEWYKPGIGAVVGATYPEELKKILALFDNNKKDVALLIPGVGAQGASARGIMALLEDSKIDQKIHRINSSSEINYAFEKTGSKDYASCAVEALQKLIDETKI